MEISVVTAVYNGEQYLEESIESIVSQTFRNFEYIIVIDGSNDNTKEILDNLTDPGVKVIHLEKNGGAANALNIGINAARGRWIALQDADDVSSKHRLQRQLEYMSSDARLVAVGSLIRCIPGKDPVNQSTFANNPKQGGSVYNLGGGRSSNISILEAIRLIQEIIVL